MGQSHRVTTAFSFLSDPSGIVYTPGDIVDPDRDPYLKRRDKAWRDAHLEPVEATAARRTARTRGDVVETATAAPGERRTRTRAAKKATAKKAAPTKRAAAKKAAPKPADTPLPTGDNAPADPPSSEVL